MLFRSPSVISAKMGQAMSQPNPQAEQAKQIQMAGAQAEVAQKASAAELNRARARRELASIGNDGGGSSPMVDQAEAHAKLVDAEARAQVHQSNVVLNIAKAERQRAEAEAVPFREHHAANTAHFSAMAKAANDRARAAQPANFT